MPRRSKVKTILPAALREQLDKKLIEKSFSGYDELESWLAAEGYQISSSALQRYGASFEGRLEAVAHSTRQAKALVEVAGDEAGAMTDALSRLVQEKMFGILVECNEQPLTERQIAWLAKAVADLGRATISQRRWAQEVRERLDAQKRAAACQISGLHRSGGLSDEAEAVIRKVLLDIDPLPKASPASTDTPASAAP